MPDVCLCVNNDIRYCYSLTSTVAVQVISWESSLFCLSFSAWERQEVNFYKRGSVLKQLRWENPGWQLKRTQRNVDLVILLLQVLVNGEELLFTIQFISLQQTSNVSLNLKLYKYEYQTHFYQERKKKRAFWWSKIIWAGWHTQR